MIQTGIVYLIVLWDFFLSRVQMYRATQYTKGLNNAIRFGWIAIIVIFVVEFVYDLVRGFFAAGILRLIVLAVYTAVLAIGTLIVVILFLSYGQKMYRRLKIFNSKFGDTKKEKKMRKVQFTLHLFVCFFCYRFDEKNSVSISLLIIRSIGLRNL
jgi:chromate transport protein ChrA